jgi:dihydrofolate reductase
MRKLIITEFISADGFADVEKLNVAWNDEMQAFKDEELDRSGAMLIGRKTYDIFAGHWPKQAGEFADRFNGLTKYVASTTLKQVDWKPSEVLQGDLADAVLKLKQAEGGDIYVHGSLNLAQQLLTLGLVDRVRLLSYPLALGEGKRLFGPGEQKLELISAKPFNNGVVALEYAARR